MHEALTKHIVFRVKHLAIINVPSAVLLVQPRNVESRRNNPETIFLLPCFSLHIHCELK